VVVHGPEIDRRARATSRETSSLQRKSPLAEWPEMSGDAMVRTTIDERDEAGATTAEYAVCTGAGVGFAGLLFKFLTSDTGQHIVKTVFDHVLKVLPF
jgi:hypothetical protein